MRANQSERMRRSIELEGSQNRQRANQIEKMIAEFDRMCIELGHQIAAEERHSRIYDPTHFAYPTFARATRERRSKLQASADALKVEFHKARLEADEALKRQAQWESMGASYLAALVTAKENPATRAGPS